MHYSKNLTDFQLKNFKKIQFATKFGGWKVSENKLYDVYLRKTPMDEILEMLGNKEKKSSDKNIVEKSLSRQTEKNCNNDNNKKVEKTNTLDLSVVGKIVNENNSQLAIFAPYRRLKNLSNQSIDNALTLKLVGSYLWINCNLLKSTKYTKNDFPDFFSVQNFFVGNDKNLVDNFKFPAEYNFYKTSEYIKTNISTITEPIIYKIKYEKYKNFLFDFSLKQAPSHEKMNNDVNRYEFFCGIEKKKNQEKGGKNQEPNGTPQRPTGASENERSEPHERSECKPQRPTGAKKEKQPRSEVENHEKNGENSTGENYFKTTIKSRLFKWKSLLEYELKNGGLFDDFDTFKSINDVTKDGVLNIGFDCEWRNLDKPKPNKTWRDILSYQFSFCFNGYFYEFIFVVNEKENPNFIRLYTHQAFSCIFNYLAKENSFIQSLSFPYTERELKLFTYGLNKLDNENYKSDKELLKKFRKRIVGKSCISINLISHFGEGDLSAFNDFDLFWNKLTFINKCPVSQNLKKRNIKLLAKFRDYNKHYRAYYIKLNVRDTGLQAAPGSKALSVLGDAIHYPKIDVGAYRENNMIDLLHDNFELFLNYSVTDATISCLYTSLIYGFNCLFPMTITSAAATIAYNKIYTYFDCESKEHFNRIYRGLVEDTSIAYDAIPDYILGTRGKELLPVSSNVNIIQIFCSNAYFGGYNMCSRVGYYKEKTNDFDLQNAYPTAMVQIPDINWEQPIKREITNCFLKKGDLTPTKPFVCSCKFKFPKNIKFPCIPIKSSGCLIYPLESSGNANVRYAAGPFIYLALELGAEIYVERGFYLNTLPANNKFDCLAGSISYAIKQMINDRRKAKELFGAKSLQELIFKVCVNSTYGKTAQNVSLKRTYDAFIDEMCEMGSSIITNPFAACFTTSLVQAWLLAACNEIESSGYRVYSATTDGFISNAPYEFVENMNLYGFKEYLTQSRLFLTGKPEAWEIKHSQQELLNFTTRGNVGVNFTSDTINNGVLAHAGMINKDVKKDSVEDRNKTIYNIINRDNTGRVLCLSNDWLPAKKISQGVRNKEFIDFQVVNDYQRKISGDFDLKRKINENEMLVNYVFYEGNNYELCNFSTLPYENEYEFLKVKNAKRTNFKNKALKTKQQILNFLDFVYERISTPKYIVKNKTQKELLKMCISSYRKKSCSIEFLDNLKTAKEKVNAINDFIQSQLNENFTYSLNDFYNAIKPQAIKIDTENKNYDVILKKLQSYKQ